MGNAETTQVIDLDKADFDALCKAALDSNWIPPEYTRNDWIADCCRFLQEGPDAFLTDGSRQISDDDLRKLWRDAGGRFHGPRVETGTMPESQLLPFLRLLSLRQAGAEAVKCKPLEWQLQPGCSSTFFAESVVGTWEVWKIGSGYVRGPGERAGRPVNGGLEAAKAAAQSDYETRIRSALVPSASREGNDAAKQYEWVGRKVRYEQDGHNFEVTVLATDITRYRPSAWIKLNVGEYPMYRSCDLVDLTDIETGESGPAWGPEAHAPDEKGGA